MGRDTLIYGLYCECSTCEEGDPGRIRYVGQTTIGLAGRMANHRTPSALNAGHPVSYWKLEHGVENIKGVVLEEVDHPGDLSAAETKWATRLGTYFGESEWGLNGNTGKGESRRTSKGAIEEQREATPRGEKAPQYKITDEQVRQLRAAYREGANIKAMAREYGISVTTARDIVYNFKRHDPNYKYEKIPPRRGDRHGAMKVSDADAREIWRRRRDTGATYASLAAQFGTSAQTVGAICTGKRAGIPAVSEQPDWDPDGGNEGITSRMVS